jgi:hypothetical protein
LKETRGGEGDVTKKKEKTLNVLAKTHTHTHTHSRTHANTVWDILKK